MKKQFHIFALLLFAMTQCFAPLIHAHVDGIQGDASIHTHDIPHHLSELQPSLSHIESYESRALSIPHEYHRDDTFAIQDVFFLVKHPSSRRLTKNTANSGYTHPTVAFAYQKPHTQGPPSKA